MEMVFTMRLTLSRRGIDAHGVVVCMLTFVLSRSLQSMFHREWKEGIIWVTLAIVAREGPTSSLMNKI